MLHGAAKIAREKSRQRTRTRRLWIAVFGAIALLMVAFAAVSHWWTMGLVWNNSPAVAAPLPPGVQSIAVLRTFTLSRWKFQLHTQPFTPSTSTGIPLMCIIERSNAPSVRIPPGAVMTSKASRISVPAWLPLFPILLVLSFFIDAEIRAQQRAQRGCCPTCGYNLKGIEPIDGQTTCPECGGIKKHRPKVDKVVLDPLATDT